MCALDLSSATHGSREIAEFTRLVACLIVVTDALYRRVLPLSFAETDSHAPISFS